MTLLTAAEGPLRGAEKERYVHGMFNSIARYYDAMNLVMSGGMLKLWHRAVVRQADFRSGQRVLDVACGTGDLSLLAARHVRPAGRVIGVDISEGMLDYGRRRVERSPDGGLIEMKLGNAQALEFPDGTFDRVTTGFALRNFSDLPKALSEMARVLKPGGRLLALEISRPKNPLLRAGFLLYFDNVVPLIDWVVEGVMTRRRPTIRAYRYLPDSLKHHPDQDALAQMMNRAGFVNVRYHLLSGGVVTLHVGEKPDV